MLRKPVPTGVVIGAFRAHLRAADAVQHAVGQRRAGAGHHIDAGLLHVPVDLHAGRVDARAGGFGQFRSGAVAGNQRHVVGHVLTELRLRTERQKSVQDRESRVSRQRR